MAKRKGILENVGMTDLKKIYKGKKVLVTGHTGFKGSWLSVWLTELGAEVIGYSLEPPSEPNMFGAIHLTSRIKDLNGDIRDGELLSFVFAHEKPDIVFHLAAQPIVRRSYKEPKLTYETNIMGTVNVLEAVRATKSVRACVIVTSDKCYYNKEYDYAYKETDPMGGDDPYSSSKGCAELITAAYRESFFNRNDYGKTHNTVLSTVRAGNVIGGGDWGEDRIVPDCIKAIASNEKIHIRSPEAIRPWQYVLEPLYGYLLLAGLMFGGKSRYGDAWNFGLSDDALWTVEKVVKRIIVFSHKGQYTIDMSNQPHEATLLKLDTSKARKVLGWKPIFSTSESIKKTVDWYKRFYEGVGEEELYNFTVDEIKEYEGLMELEK